MILSKIDRLRDPAILVENGVYYAYGTGWVCYKNTSGSLDGEWESLGMVATVPKNAQTNYWAPEVHKYNGEFYMFTTYKSSENGHRGCTIMKSSSPEGPFIEISNGHLTPCDWDAIDATFYVDEEGQPWMVFVHEWTSTDDGIGRMCVAKMSDDLSSLISEPKEIFRADDGKRGMDRQVTDGPYIHICEDGKLIMLWSNVADNGYAVGMAESYSIDGEWKQQPRLLFHRDISGTDYDGGHGMLFTDNDGRLMLSVHSPNSSGEGYHETAVFHEVVEVNGTLRLKTEQEKLDKARTVLNTVFTNLAKIISTIWSVSIKIIKAIINSI